MFWTKVLEVLVIGQKCFDVCGRPLKLLVAALRSPLDVMTQETHSMICGWRGATVTPSNTADRSSHTLKTASRKPDKRAKFTAFSWTTQNWHGILCAVFGFTKQVDLRQSACLCSIEQESLPTTVGKIWNRQISETDREYILYRQI